MNTMRIRPRQQIYGALLARIHAEAFADRFAPAWPWLAAQIGEASARPCLFDIGCGDGRWLAHAIETGIEGEGIDISEEFVRLAQARGLRGLRVRHDSAQHVAPPPQTTAATALGEVLAYKPASLAPAIRRLARALPPGGLIFFDLPGPDTPEGDDDRGGKGWRLSVRARKSGRDLLRKIQVETARGREIELHELRLFAPEEALEIVEGLGLAGEILESYGPCPLAPGRFAIRAVKP